MENPLNRFCYLFMAIFFVMPYLVHGTDIDPAIAACKNGAIRLDQGDAVAAIGAFSAAVRLNPGSSRVTTTEALRWSTATTTSPPLLVRSSA